MSGQTTDRLLEAALSPILAAALGNTIFLYVRNEDLPDDPNGQGLPCVVLLARVTGDYKAIKLNGRWADICELRFECRVAGNADDSSSALEDLAQKCRQVIEVLNVANQAARLALSGLASGTVAREVDTGNFYAWTGSAWAARTYNFSAFDYLHWEPQGDETAFENGARVKTLIYEVRAHTI